MTMTTTQAIITIAAVVLGTMATRFIPFIIFPEGKNPPEFIKYLGTVLPYAAIGLLVIYCLKDVPASSTHGLPEAIAIVFIVLLHKWKKTPCTLLQKQNYFYVHFKKAEKRYPDAKIRNKKCHTHNNAYQRACNKI